MYTYVTDFSDEAVDNVSPVNATPAPSVNKAKVSTKKDFNVGDRGVDQGDFGTYLQSRRNGVISMRYQSARAGSARYWRDIKLVKYDDTYLYAEGTDYPIKYRRDRVIEFR